MKKRKAINTKNLNSKFPIEEENQDLDRLKIIELTYNDGHEEYQVEGKMYGYYEDVLKFQYGIRVCSTLPEAKEELRKAKDEILSKELNHKKEII